MMCVRRAVRDGLSWERRYQALDPAHRFVDVSDDVVPPTVELLFFGPVRQSRVGIFDQAGDLAETSDAADQLCKDFRIRLGKRLSLAVRECRCRAVAGFGVLTKVKQIAQGDTSREAVRILTVFTRAYRSVNRTFGERAGAADFPKVDTDIR
jgi:hypothetical protein